MADIYTTEPTTDGKVLIETSIGDIDIELWSKETPLAAKNFLQHCLDGYYDGCIFHRVVKDFIAQTGDPLGTGTGGEGAYETTFKDEFHQRLRFVRRGLVAMANAGSHDNASQFFFTLDATPDLNKKHTIFGKVTGPTIFNMMRLNELDMSEKDPERPKRPPFIKKTTVLNLGPFTDLVDRQLEVKYDFGLGKRINRKEYDLAQKEAKMKKFKSKAVKNTGLLSFGADEDEESDTESEEEKFVPKKKMVSLYDIPKQVEPEVKETAETDDKGAAAAEAAAAGPAMNPNRPDETSSSEEEYEDDEDQNTSNFTNNSFNQHQKVLYETTEQREKREKMEAKVAKKEAKLARIEAKELEKKQKKKDNPLLKELHDQQQKYKKIHKDSTIKNKKKREQNTLSMLDKFSSKNKEVNLKGKFKSRADREEMSSKRNPMVLYEDEKATSTTDSVETETQKITPDPEATAKRKRKNLADDWKDYGFVLTEEQELANKSSSEDDDFDIWTHKFAPSAEKKLTIEAKKFNVSERDAKDATMKKDENTHSLHDPRNELNKRRRLGNKENKGKKLGTGKF